MMLKSKLQCSIRLAITRASVHTPTTYVQLKEDSTKVVSKSAITRTFNNYAKDNDLLKTAKITLSGNDIREGITAVVSVKVLDLSLKAKPNLNLEILMLRVLSKL